MARIVSMPKWPVPMNECQCISFRHYELLDGVLVLERCNRCGRQFCPPPPYNNSLKPTPYEPAKEAKPLYGEPELPEVKYSQDAGAA